MAMVSKLRKIRLDNRLTIKDVSSMIGLKHPSTLSNWETGKIIDPDNKRDSLLPIRNLSILYGLSEEEVKSQLRKPTMVEIDDSNLPKSKGRIKDFDTCGDPVREAFVAEAQRRNITPSELKKQIAVELGVSTTTIGVHLTRSAGACRSHGRHGHSFDLFLEAIKCDPNQPGVRYNSNGIDLYNAEDEETVHAETSYDPSHYEYAGVKFNSDRYQLHEQEEVITVNNPVATQKEIDLILDCLMQEIILKHAKATSDGRVWDVGNVRAEYDRLSALVKTIPVSKEGGDA